MQSQCGAVVSLVKTDQRGQCRAFHVETNELCVRKSRMSIHSESGYNLGSVKVVVEQVRKNSIISRRD